MSACFSALVRHNTQDAGSVGYKEEAREGGKGIVCV